MGKMATPPNRRIWLRCYAPPPKFPFGKVLIRSRRYRKFGAVETNINDVTNNIIRWLIMINEREKGIITRCAKKYKVSSIYLFGSSLDIDSAPNDIDLAVEGIRPEIFFKFYGELLRSLSKPVDLVDLSRKSLFNRIIEEKGVKIYG
jgi:predicted nucleotidyltransferase